MVNAVNTMLLVFFMEILEKELRIKKRITRRNPSRLNELIEAQNELDSVNTSIEKLKKQRKVISVILKDEPDPTPEISMNPELSM